MNINFSILGHNVNINPSRYNSEDEIYTDSPVTKEGILKAIKTLEQYQKDKSNLEAKIIDNEKWYRLQHWDLIRKAQNANEPEPTSGYLLNTLMNKHADAMDNYPSAQNILPKDKEDVQESKRLRQVIPAIYDMVMFRKTYSDAWWYKLKHGFVIYGAFWDNEKENGLGDINIPWIDALNVFWQSGITNIQQSKNLFICSQEDTEDVEEQYPHVKGLLKDSKMIQLKQYVQDDNIKTEGKTVVADWYYRKKNSEGNVVLHLTKFAGEHKLWSSEDDENLRETGIYISKKESGRYPVVFSVLFPETGTPIGFGYIDVVKNPQVYIDKLDQIISRNAFQSGKKRYLYRPNSGLNIEDFLDYSKDAIACEGSLSEEHIRELTTSPLPPFISEHRRFKIEELKEVSGVNEFTRGEGGKGVTAASAIRALQEAGNKISRDMLKSEYDCFAELTHLVIDRVRQFYDLTRSFRIDKPDQTYDFVDYSNEGLKEQVIEGVGETGYRIPDFDVSVVPEKSDPFSRMAQNEMAKEMFGMGIFLPDRADAALIALEIMEFEGKEKIVEMVQRNASLYQQNMQMQQTLARLQPILQQLTGQEGVING